MPLKTRDEIAGAALVFGYDRKNMSVVEFTGVVNRSKSEGSSGILPLSGAGGLPASGSGSGLRSTGLSKVVDTISGRVLGRYSDISERLELLRTGHDAVLPIQGDYWETLKSYMDGESATYSGDIDEQKAKELGLYNSGKKPIQIYEDKVLFPR